MSNAHKSLRMTPKWVPVGKHLSIMGVWANPDLALKHMTGTMTNCHSGRLKDGRGGQRHHDLDSASYSGAPLTQG